MQVGACSVPTCIRIPPYSSRNAPIHQYTQKQNNTPTYSRRLLRINVITFKTCWAIKNFHKVTSSWFNLFNYILYVPHINLILSCLWKQNTLHFISFSFTSMSDSLFPLDWSTKQACPVIKPVTQCLQKDAHKKCILQTETNANKVTKNIILHFDKNYYLNV